MKKILYHEERLKIQRNNQIIQESSVNLIPGDIIILEENQILTCDVMLLEGNEVIVNESLLTGYLIFYLK